jgi:hypothetical protein
VDTAAIVAIAASGLTAGVGALFSLFNVGRDFQAEHDLARLMSKPAHSGTLRQLQQARDALAKTPPDQAKLEGAAEVVETLASELPRRKERAIRAHLRQNSEMSAAGYVVKLIDEAEHRTNAGEARA